MRGKCPVAAQRVPPTVPTPWTDREANGLGRYPEAMIDRGPYALSVSDSPSFRCRLSLGGDPDIDVPLSMNRAAKAAEAQRPLHGLMVVLCRAAEYLAAEHRATRVAG